MSQTKYCGYIRVPFEVKHCDLNTFNTTELPTGWDVYEHYLTPIFNILIFEFEGDLSLLEHDIRVITKLIIEEDKLGEHLHGY